MRIVFTEHALERLAFRKLRKDEVLSVIRYPGRTIKRYGKYIFLGRVDRGRIEVVCEKKKTYLKVVTIYWL